jgi:hypothetical protein
MQDQRSVFLSHASEDKAKYVLPFAHELDNAGISYWLDQGEIRWGDNITKNINLGLRLSEYVVVFISDQFIGKRWPEAELESALALENVAGRTVVLPLVLTDIQRAWDYYPLLRAKLCLQWKQGIPSILTYLERVLEDSQTRKKPSYEGSVMLQQKGVALHLTVINEHAFDPISLSLGYGSGGDTLQYEAIDTGQEIEIKPHMKYLSRLNEEKYIDAFVDLSADSRFRFPQLDIKVVNNGHETIVVTDAVFEVENSSIDPWPVLVIHGIPRGFVVRNEGWGWVEDCTIAYNVFPAGTPVSLGGSYDFSENAGNFLDDYHVSLEKTFKLLGITDYHGLKELIDGQSESGEEAKSGFIHRDVIVVGQITFSGKTLSRQWRGETLKFNVPVALYDKAGETLSPSFTYKALLRETGKQYETQVPVAHVLKPGDADRFTITMAVGRSSLHRFGFKLLYNDGQTVRSKPVNLLIFVPRSKIQRIRGAQISHGNDVNDS